ncbi:MAG: Ig-like domain-containing protein [Tannerellaceae bacterium]|jgi:hypothetical protein|nr:Ig-like domain-containing protein [Tannerellaceae bacterium]
MKTVQKLSVAIAMATAIIFTACEKKENDPLIPSLSPASLTVEVGSSVTSAITGGLEPFTATSSDQAKASAKVDGRTVTVTALAEGQATITVRGDDGGSAQIAVTINPKPASAPNLSASTVELEVGSTQTVTISGGTPAFTATSANTAVATVAVSGTTVTVTAVGAGTTTVTVKGSDNGSATFAVTVIEEQILFGPNKTQLGNGQKSFTITKSHTIKKGTYTLVGWIHVSEGATLTIEPGTIFKGADLSFDGSKAATGSTLIIQRGAKIIAEGTATEPIVFTSAAPKGQRQATDWGGIIICGKAHNNQGDQATIEGGVDAIHGGNDDNDNSGVLKYVRIEFGGYPYGLDNEINGLTLGSVGRATTIDHVQVSYSGDDSFEWFGGTVNAKHLVAFHGWDDDFDTDFGYSGKLQFLLAVRDPKLADQSNSNGFESDNNASGSTQEPYTSAIFSNVTVIGPLGQDPLFENKTAYINGYEWGSATDAAFPIRTGIFQAAMQIRRNSHISCFNSVFAGFPVGLMISNDGRGDSQGAAARGELIVSNVVFAGMDHIGADADKKDPTAWAGTISSGYFTTEALHNRSFPAIADLKFVHPISKRAPLLTAGYSPNDPDFNPHLQSGSPLLTGAAFTHAFLSDPFFTPVDYIGAFGGANDNWLEGWANFDPQNTDY